MIFWLPDFRVCTACRYSPPTPAINYCSIKQKLVNCNVFAFVSQHPKEIDKIDFLLIEHFHCMCSYCKKIWVSPTLERMEEYVNQNKEKLAKMQSEEICGECQEFGGHTTECKTGRSNEK